MMELPKCRTCGERHPMGPSPQTSSRGGVESRHADEKPRYRADRPGGASQVSDKTDDGARDPASVAGIASGPRETNRPGDADAASGKSGGDASSKPPSPVRFDRTTYQRELMRKRRQK